MANIHQDPPLAPYINLVDQGQGVEVIVIDSDSSVEHPTCPDSPTWECSICLEADLEVDQHTLGCCKQGLCNQCYIDWFIKEKQNSCLFCRRWPLANVDAANLCECCGRVDLYDSLDNRQTPRLLQYCNKFICGFCYSNWFLKNQLAPRQAQVNTCCTYCEQFNPNTSMISDVAGIASEHLIIKLQRQKILIYAWNVQLNFTRYLVPRI